MADNTFRTTRGSTAAPGSQQFDDPLAELARLIGQNPPAGNTADRTAPQYDAPPLDTQQPDPRWAADARYAEQEQYDERQSQYADRQGQYREGQYSDSQYGDSRYGNDYDAPRLADPAPPYRQAPPSYNADYEQPEQYPAQQQYDARGYADQPRYDDEHDPIQDLPAFLPRLRDDRHDYAQERGQERAPARGQERAQDRMQDSTQAYAQGYGQNYSQQDYEQGYAQQGDGDDQAYALEDYEEEDEAPAPKRRGFAIAAAFLGLIVLGAAGAFGYRTMFGGSMLPSLPPIIKADGTPNKIIPANSSANASGQASASNSGDKLVSREEKPVDVPAPANTPRVVSTIPVFPDPNAGLQSSAMPGGPSIAGQNMAGAVASGMPVPGAPGGPPSLGPTAAAPVYGTAPTPAGPMPGMAQMPPLQSPPVAGATSAKKIHTVAIHTGEPSSSDSGSAAPAQAAPAPAASSRTQAARPGASRPAAAAPQGGNAPLSIVPSQGGDTTPRTRTALAARPAEPETSGRGGYLVQVSSQRSEAEAQEAYRGLQAKFPSQLGGRTPTIRQVNLGGKGTFYRTMVGPYASMEQAAQMCSSLKAAGGSCIVQRN